MNAFGMITIWWILDSILNTYHMVERLEFLLLLSYVLFFGASAGTHWQVWLAIKVAIITKSIREEGQLLLCNRQVNLPSPYTPENVSLSSLIFGSNALFCP